MTQVFLLYTTGAVATWPDPGNWNPAYNIVECIGAGGSGATGSASGPGYSSVGGAGGSYAYAKNMSVTFPVSYTVPGVGNTGAATNFNSTSGAPVTTGNVVSAPCGSGGAAMSSGGGTPGAAGYPNGYQGGAGGGGPIGGGANGGGGGAAGPHGNGVAAVTATSAATPGGAADGGTTPGGAVNTAGVNGKQWDLSHGSGSGGGAGSGATAAGSGGNYGGGGGGGTTHGSGAPGIIVITYLPVNMTRIFVYPYWPAASVPGPTGTFRQFPNPGNWNPANNKIECVGMGGFGVAATFGDIGGAMGSGGGGGGYSWDQNLSPTFPVPMQVPQGNSSPIDDFSSSTWWNWVGNNSATPPTPGVIIGGYGGAASGMVGQVGTTSPGFGGGTRFGSGAGLTSNYPQANGSVGAAGGQGASVPSSTGFSAGGGGAGGLHGAGIAATASTSSASSPGGASDGGVTPGILGGPINGTQWDWLHGVGSGGSGGSNGAGGLFGGGSAGGNSDTVSNLGVGGLLVITYQPLPPPPGGQAQILA